MRRLFDKIRHKIICKREGFVGIYCPSCGNKIGDASPMLTGTFVCGECGTKFEKKIIDQ